MQPKEIALKWIAAFNRADVNSLGDLYAENAINHQVVNEPVVGQRGLKKCLNRNFRKPKWFVYRRKFFRMASGRYWNGKTRKGCVAAAFFM
ncbi:hypothetical protein BH11BAC5_BH11BAC5_16160 [soil metagenome]